MSLAADLLLLAAAAVWGATFVVVQAGLRDVSPLLFVAVRFTAAAALVAPLALWRAGRPATPAWRAGGAAGLPLLAGFALQTVGLQWTAPGRAAFLTGLYVVLVPLLAPLVGARRADGRTWAAVVLALAGIAALTRPVEEAAAGFGLGDLCMLGCALAFAVQILAVDRVGRSLPPWTLLAVELCVVAGASWPLMLALETPRFRPTPAALGALAAVVLLASVGALWAQNWAQRRMPPTRTAVIFALEPVFAAATSWLVTGERLGGWGVAGAGAILAAMVVCGRGGRT
ncbi:MAG TPA: DMT family transporter [Candidatus Polarisedimenticolaceae bacterium]|nr:DMT family transporter [Candidatus Polarisedimenticolaceae bacterium]